MKKNIFVWLYLLWNIVAFIWAAYKAEFNLILFGLCFAVINLGLYFFAVIHFISCVRRISKDTCEKFFYLLLLPRGCSEKLQSDIPQIQQMVHSFETIQVFSGISIIIGLFIFFTKALSAI